VRQKSLRQLAKEVGVSHSYLSQVKNGKRPASAKVVSKIRKNGKQTELGNATMLVDFLSGEVSELADEHDLGSCAARRRGSSPLFPIEDREWSSIN
jgi:transcriptional regulator with XRE-family HTH domain